MTTRISASRKNRPSGGRYQSCSKSMIELNPGRRRIFLTITSTCDRPIQVTRLESNREVVVVLALLALTWLLKKAPYYDYY